MVLWSTKHCLEGTVVKGDLTYKSKEMCACADGIVLVSVDGIGN